MNNPVHISESLETIFWVKILTFFDADPGSGVEKFGFGMEKIRIRDKHPGSAILLIFSSDAFVFLDLDSDPWTQTNTDVK